MAISYNPLWVLLARKSLKKGDLMKLAGISSPTMARMSKNEYVSLEILERICKNLNCQIADIIVYEPQSQDMITYLSDNKKIE